MRALLPGGLLRDRFVQASIAFFALLLVPYVVPVLSDDQMWTYAAMVIELPLLLLAIAAAQYELGQLDDAEERRFWHLVTAGLTCWLLQNLLTLQLTPREGASVLVELARNGLYFGLYFFLAVALETRPHASAPLTGRLRAFDHLGAFVFLFGQLLYFAVIPSLIDPDMYWTSSLLLYVVLDAYLVVRLGGFRRHTVDPIWRSVYSWLWLATLWWFVTDLVEMLMWADVVPYVESGTLIDLFWLPPLLIMVLAARSRHLPAWEGRRRVHQAQELAVVGPLAVYAMGFPVIHFVAYSSGLAEARLEPIRGWISLAFFLLVMAMTFVYQELLRRETRRLESQRRDAQAVIEHQAYHDHLTGLPNRLLLTDHLHLAMANARRFQRPVAVLFLDLDEFKIVNDSLGHAAGDSLLVGVSQRLRDACRPGDTVARLGGDEFVVLGDGLSEATDAAKVARKLLGAFEDPFSIAGRELSMTTSIGVAVFPGDGESSEELLSNADIAMYQAKRSGRGTYRLFTSAMNDQATARLALEESLQGSIARSEFFLVYQPIVELDSGNAVGVEALLRWRHPERGVIRPGSFIGVAETTGLIRPMGMMALEIACRQLVEWHQQGVRLRLSVNLSVRQLESAEFLGKVEALLGSTGADPSLLEVEVTESMVIEHAEDILPCLKALRKLGFRVSLDDFGTRYSSLSRLLELPVDTLKLDRSFVDGIDRKERWGAVVGAVMTMARDLGLAVVAEGIERETQRSALIERGCVLGQGYLFSPGVPAEEVTGLLSVTAGRGKE